MKGVFHFFKKKANDSSGALNITHHPFIEKIVTQPGFPWLISFPRTGSHWLRMIMELYFEKPSLVEVYFFKNAKEFTCYHRHDTHLTVGGCTNVIYLYREPIDTVFSYMKYKKENLDDKEKVLELTNNYVDHLSKWIFDEKFTEHKTLISYDKLKADLDNEFIKICKHFNVHFNSEKLKEATLLVSKEKLKSKASHDKNVVNTSESYSLERDTFRTKFGVYINETVKGRDARLVGLFDSLDL